MIEGTMMHTDSIGSKQLIRPKQVNLMTAGYGISHTEVAPDTETRMHAAQLWIALPDDKINMAPQFDHYPVLPIVEKDNIEFTVLVGEFMDTVSPVQVHTELLGIDFFAKEQTKTRIPLNPKFEYGFMALEGDAIVNGHDLNSDNMVVLEPGISQIEVELPKGSRLLLIGGEPFESPILLWWNLVGRTQEELKTATEQWINQDARFGTIPDYDGPRLEAPAFPDKMRPSK
jgi:redox-sensitive bicupin YhaK (pirin superfamily)